MSPNKSGPDNLDARVDEIFDRALDLPHTERETFLDEACCGHVAMRTRVERLLAFSDTPPSILEDPAVVTMSGEALDATADSGMPTEVGPYRILKELGRGGMGVVYLGARADGHFEQEVAVKVMRPGSDTADARRTFEQERQIIASLQHGNIAKLYDGGVTGDGQPFSAMELVDGIPITDYCDENRLSLVERLRLVEVVASAVHHAHQNLVVHCDLKPSNILVTATGEIKLLDFGVARLLDVTGAGDSSSASNSRGVTPLYASPEQLRGEPVTTASDVYQLGLLLFELLTGERAREAVYRPGKRAVDPIALPPTRRTPSAAVLAAPAQRVNQVAEARCTTPRALVRSLRHDLDLIVESALCSQPNERYPSAAELVEDLKRYRRSEPLAAHPGTLPYRASRFVKRHRLGVAIAALLVVLLTGYSITVTVQAQRILRERDRAQRIQAFAIGLYGAGDPNRVLGRELSATDLVDQGVARANVELAEEPEVQADVKAYLGRVYMRLGRYEEAETLLREVLALRERLHGESQTEAATARHELGELLLERDDPEALSLLEAALEQRRRLLGDDHLDTALTLSSLGFYLRSAGRHQESEKKFREALRIQRRRDPDGVTIAHTLSGLGWTVRTQDRPREAEPILREALSIFRRHYEDQHPEVAASWNNLASVLWQLEHWSEGDDAIRQSIDSKKRLYGNTHPSIAVSLGNHAGSLRRRGELEPAAALYRQAMDMRQEVFGPSHPRVAQSTAQLAEVLRDAGQLEEAEELFVDALAIFREHLPEGHPSFGRVWYGLGAVRLAQGKLNEARRAVDQARAIYSGVDNPVWPWRLDVVLAEIDRKQGRPKDAAAKLAAAEGKLGNQEWLARWREEQANLEAD